MGFLASLRQSARPRLRGAAFPAADLGRLSASWTTDPGSINRWLRYELRTLRARSRQLARGDAYGARFIRACVDNIAGPKPFILQAKARFADGRFDETANDNIEVAYADRARPGNYEITGRMSRAAFIRLKIRCLARDGEVLVRTIRGGAYGAAGIKQIIDIDRLDEQKNANLSDGGAVKMGVQLDRYGKPVAYHLLKQHPGEMGEWNRGLAREHEVVPADQVQHLFIPDWPEQVRGFPWMHAAMVRLWNLGGFEDAAVINARIGASKIAVLQTPDGNAAPLASGRDTAGNLLDDIEPGQYWVTPPGTQLETFDPNFPDASVGPFIQACLRGAAAAVGMAYHSFANDPGSVNYSTARVALLDERDGWSAIQQWYVEHDCEPDGVDWLRGAIIDGVLPGSYWRHRNALTYQPRTWQWIDPEKEVKAKVLALENKLTSRTRIAAENGEDFADIVDELAADDALMKDKGIVAEPPKPKEPSNGEQTPAGDEAGSSGAAE